MVNPPDTLIKRFLSFDNKGNLKAIRNGRDSTVFYYSKKLLIGIKLPKRTFEPDSLIIMYKYGKPYMIENYLRGKQHSISKINVSDNSIDILRYSDLDESEIWRLDTYIFEENKLIVEIHQKYEDNNIVKKYKYNGDMLISDSWITDNTRITTLYDSISRPIKRIERNMNDFKTYWTYEYRYYQNDLFPTEIISTNIKGKSTIRYFYNEK